MILGDMLVDPWKSIKRYIKLKHGFQLECIHLINIQIKNIFPRWALMMVRREHRRVGGDTQVSLINFFPSFLPFWTILRRYSCEYRQSLTLSPFRC